MRKHMVKFCIIVPVIDWSEFNRRFYLKTNCTIKGMGDFLLQSEYPRKAKTI